jgi:type II secretory pathway predicted ATPase ExeA
VAEAIDIAQQDGILVISSVPGTGKTILQQLIKKELEQKHNCKAYLLNPSSRRNNADFDLFDYVADKTGDKIPSMRV